MRGEASAINSLAVANRVFAVVGAKSLVLKIELDLGSQVDLIPDILALWVINLGYVVCPCSLNIFWVQTHMGYNMYALCPRVSAFSGLFGTSNSWLVRPVCLFLFLSFVCPWHRNLTTVRPV